MKYVFQYETLVNRDYNIYKEIIINPFYFSFLGLYDPTTIKNIVDYTKEKDFNVLKRIIPGANINTITLGMIYTILKDYKYFETEPFNIFSRYVDELILSEKVEDVYITVKEILPNIESQVIDNIKRRFGNNPKLHIVKLDDVLVSKGLQDIEWNCVFLRDIEQAVSIITSDLNIKDKDIVLEEGTFNKLDPVNYILLQEKEARIDYRAMI